MKNIIKKLIFLYLMVILSISKIEASSINGNSKDVNIDTNQKIYDYADIFGTSEEIKLYNQVKKIIDKYNIDVVIATIDNNPLYNTRDYAEHFYDSNNFGIGADGEGLILLIDMDYREYYILTTGETVDIITDLRVEDILDRMENNMISGDYYDAAKSFLKQTNKYYFYHKYGPPYLWLGAIIGAIIIAIIRLNKEKKKLNLINDQLEATNYLLDKEIEYQDDDLVDTKRRVIHNTSTSSRSGGRSRGGFSGGGRRHGGGGRRF